jgi:hypothetical protein
MHINMQCEALFLAAENLKIYTTQNSPPARHMLVNAVKKYLVP